MFRILALAEKATNQTQLAKPTLTRPGEGSGIQTDGTVLDVATTATDEVNSLSSELGHGRLTAHLELSLLDVDDHLSSGQAALMTRITANTYTEIRFRSPFLQSTCQSTHPPTFQQQTYPSYQIDCSSDSLNVPTRDWEKGVCTGIPLVIKPPTLISLLWNSIF